MEPITGPEVVIIVVATLYLLLTFVAITMGVRLYAKIHRTNAKAQEAIKALHETSILLRETAERQQALLKRLGE